MNNTTERPDSYFDENSLLHVKRGEYSENGVLFTAHYQMLSRLLGKVGGTTHDRMGVYRTFGYNEITRKHFFDPNPAHDNDENSHFSHDNLTGLHCYMKTIGDNAINRLPTFRWNNRNWLHPRDIIFYSIMKEKKWAYLLSLVLVIASVISCVAPRGKTSGKCLWWLRLQTLKLHPNKLLSLIGSSTLKLVENVMSKEHGDKVWIDTFSIYFAEPDHPVNELIREYYGKGL